MERIAIIGNSGGGKSTLSQRLAVGLDLPWFEIDRFLWRPGWELASTEDYEAEHTRILALNRWLLDGLGRIESLPARLARASAVVLIDLPLETHLHLAVERQEDWAAGRLKKPPAGAATPPSDEAIVRNILEIERDWMPAIRDQVAAAHGDGRVVHRLASLDELAAFEEAALAAVDRPGVHGQKPG